MHVGSRLQTGLELISQSNPFAFFLAFVVTSHEVAYALARRRTKLQNYPFVPERTRENRTSTASAIGCSGRTFFRLRSFSSVHSIAETG